MKHPRLVIISLVAVTLTAIPVAVAVGARSSPSISDLALLNGVIQLVERDYVHPIGSHELTKDALKGMLNRLDPHSDYMDEQEFKESQSNISGRFGGLGIEISEQNGVPKVISPIDGTPAMRAGLQPGDLIVEIDGQSSQGLSLDKVVHVLRGEPGTKVKLSILRGGKEPFQVTITRSIIEVQTVKSKLEPNNIAYARVTEFGENSARDLEKALKKMRSDAGGKLNGVVLDLRNDPGGLLTAAVEIAGDFLKGGTVVTIKGRRSEDNQAYKVPQNGTIVPDAPMVVLINGASASASEIVAGALQDRKRATIMGTQSFGKGSVQTIIQLNGHGALRLTTALYYTPAGRSIQGQGISPDVVVEAPKDQQISGFLLPHESSLRGAFRNPGRLNKPAGKGGAAKEPAEAAKNSPPIKADLIGADNDAQLKAALAYLEKNKKAIDKRKSGSAC
jgi:carboxyl-terminal processing protease